jgi:N-acetylneuraminic acid mutarotase
MVVFGGIISSTSLFKYSNTTFYYDLETNSWSDDDSSISPKPTPRCNHATIIKNDKLYLYGG